MGEILQLKKELGKKERGRRNFEWSGEQKPNLHIVGDKSGALKIANFNYRSIRNKRSKG